MTQHPTRLLTCNEAAGRLGLRPCTLRKWIAERRLAYVKLGRAVRIPHEAVEALVREGLRPALPTARERDSGLARRAHAEPGHAAS